MKNTASLLALLVVATGCTADTSTEALDLVQNEGLALLDGTPDGVGVLDLLNDPGTTQDVLDHDAALNARTARNLILERSIAPFSTIADVDDVPWVGPAALNALVAYAQTEGWVPEGGDVLGIWDRVEFTVDEAEATLALVNASSFDELDIDLGLNRRAADSIVAAQPVPSVAHLAGLYHVGRSALNTLLDEAVSVAPEPALPFEDQFNHDEELDIPDGSNSGIDSDVHVHGVPDQPVAVTLVIDFEHEALWELSATLTNPEGDTVQVDITGAVIRQPVWISGNPNGVWTLNVTDGIPGFSGTQRGWALEVVSVD
jgi:hypothetical protein